MSDPTASFAPSRDEYARRDLPNPQPPWWKRFDLRRPSFVVAASALVALTLLLIYVAVFVLPQQLVPDPSASDLAALKPAERIQAETATAVAQNAVRTTLIQAIAGGLFFVTAFVAWQQVRTARQGQATDRFTKSIEQLGDNATDVRLGGIYALEQMSSLEAFRRPVAEILGAYLRTHSLLEDAVSLEPPPAAERRRDEGTAKGPAISRTSPSRNSPSLEAQRASSPDKQAVLRILIDEGLWKRANSSFLDLSFVSLRGVVLRDSDLRNCLLRGADLSFADLRGAVLPQVDVRFAVLRSANMASCDMRNAILEDADLTGADLTRCRMVEAQAARAILRGCRLTGADLTGADLTGADLRGATLNGAILTGAVLLGARYSEASLYNLGDTSGAQLDELTAPPEVRIDEESRRRLFGAMFQPAPENEDL